MLYDKIEVAAIKIAVSNLEGIGLNCKEVLLKSISWLLDKYEVFGEETYLVKAVWIIYAYLELGFPFEDGKEIFYVILKLMDKDVEEMFPACKWRYKKIVLNKMNVRELLGRWNPGLHSMKITEAVDDIIHKVSEKEKGVYIYHCGKILEINNEVPALWEHTYRLQIDEENAVFYDINKNKYYVFV